jgi:hypothetical protein
MAQPLLEGQVYEQPVDRLQELREEFEEYQRQVQEALSRVMQSIAVIRQGLRMAGGDEVAMPAGAAAPQFDPKWSAWMEKFGRDKCVSRVIQAILDHGPLSRSQLRQATKSGWSTLDEATARLKNLQLIEKSGDRWNLKG